MNLATGERVGDRLRVEGLVSEGGSACVYRVRHEALGVVYALKVLTPRSPFPAERLLREGRIQAALRHPCIVQVVDVVEVAGAQALIMEYVDGPTLAGLGGGMERGVARTLYADVLAAVGAAHAHGVLHRDLKPQNILLAPVTGGWLPKVADFGIARIVEAGDTRPGVTRFGVGMGTPGYTSPEQLRDAASVDARADIYSLGVLLFELLTGHLPFDADPDGPRMLAPVSGDVPEVDILLARMLASDPEARPASVAEVAEALYADEPRLLDIALGRAPPLPVGMTGLVRPVPVDAATTGTGGSNLTIVPGVASPPSSPSSGRSVVWLGVVGLVAVAAVGGVFLGPWLRSGSAPTVDAATPPAIEVAEAREEAGAAALAGALPGAQPVDPAAVPVPGSAPPIASPDATAAASSSTAAVRPAAGASPAPVGTPVAATDPVGAPAAAVAVSAAAPDSLSATGAVVADAAPAASAASGAPEGSAASSAVAPPTSAPAVAVPSGEWTGTLGGRPFLVRFSSADPLEAEVTLAFGVTERTTRYRGSVSADGTVRLVSVDGDGVLLGRFSGGSARGTLVVGKGRPMDWQLSR